jgi:hypothetical protein
VAVRDGTLAQPFSENRQARTLHSTRGLTWRCRLNDHLKIALGIVLGAIIAATVIAGLQTSGTTFTLEKLGQLASALVVLLTLGMAVLTGFLVRETRQLWVQNRLPHLVVTLEPYHRYMGFFELVIENVGSGPAYNVKTTLEPDIEVKSDGRVIKLSEISMFSLSVLKPKQRISTFGGKYNEFSPRKTTVSCECQDTVGERHTFINAIDIDVYDSLSGLGEDPLGKTADELEKLRRAVESFATGFKRLNVDVHSAVDRKEEARVLEERFKRQREQRGT